jgi:rhomboid protease GluP
MWGPAERAGEWWRIITGAFLHGGLTHVAFNMFALYQVGRMCEWLFGPARMAFVYTISMVGSGIAVYLFSYYDVTVGASGAIFGVFGALAAAGLRLGAPGRDLVRQTVGVIVINLLLGFLLPNISNAGHIGGLVSGFVAGFLVMPRIRLAAAPAAVAEAAPGDETIVQTPEDEPSPSPSREAPL